MKLRYKIGLLLSGLLGIFFWGWFHGRQSVVPATPASLPANDKEQITVDPRTHKLTILTAKGVQTLFLPDRATTIDITKAGNAVVHDKQYGLEMNPFIGGAYGLHHGVVAIGTDVAYFHRLDLGVALGLPSPFSFSTTSVLALVSYDVWRDTRLSVGIDQHKSPYIGVTVRL